MTLEEEVTRWLHLDNKLKQQNETIKELRESKNQIEGNIAEYANENNINNLSIKTNEGILKLVNVKTTSPLTFKYIEKCLSEILNDDEQIQHIINYLKEKRTITHNHSIKKFNV